MIGGELIKTTLWKLNQGRVGWSVEECCGGVHFAANLAWGCGGIFRLNS